MENLYACLAIGFGLCFAGHFAHGSYPPAKDVLRRLARGFRDLSKAFENAFCVALYDGKFKVLPLVGEDLWMEDTSLTLPGLFGKENELHPYEPWRRHDYDECLRYPFKGRFTCEINGRKVFSCEHVSVLAERLCPASETAERKALFVSVCETLLSERLMEVLLTEATVAEFCEQTANVCGSRVSLTVKRYDPTLKDKDLSSDLSSACCDGMYSFSLEYWQEGKLNVIFDFFSDLGKVVFPKIPVTLSAFRIGDEELVTSPSELAENPKKEVTDAEGTYWIRNSEGKLVLKPQKTLPAETDDAFFEALQKEREKERANPGVPLQNRHLLWVCDYAQQKIGRLCVPINQEEETFAAEFQKCRVYFKLLKPAS